jgi:hypothetical protein
MTTFPRSPKLLKGAIIGVDLYNPLASVVVFQYNPESLTRRLTARAANPNPARGEALRLSGPPQEAINLTVEIDAADQLERSDAMARALGLYPTLASLEMLLYPKSETVIANEVLARVGVIEVIPPEAPLTLFVWGPKRILPVRLTEFSVNEEFFDPDLNPIRAKVTLGMSVLTYHELGLLSVGGALYMANQVAKEVMASAGGVATLAGSASSSLDASISL